MRLLVFFAAAAACAQILDPASSAQQLREFLGLTSGQLEKIALNNGAYLANQRTLFRRVNAVNTEIADETSRPTPDPVALGVRYQEIEYLCRQNEAPLRMLEARQSQVLTTTQRDRLGTLDQTRRLWVLAGDARNLFLLPAGALLPAANGNREVTPELAHHLELSEAQPEGNQPPHRRLSRIPEPRPSAHHRARSRDPGRTARRIRRPRPNW